MLPDDFETSLLAFTEEHDISKRECEVVRLICRGLSNQEISETLFISLQTVKDHTHRIFVKTGVRNRVQLSNMIR
jgi:ATP/maltotriose-dependent transcriptional regulator MalT